MAYNYNPEKAKALMSEAGYPNGFRLRERHFAARGLLGDHAADDQDQLRRVGIDMKLQIKDHTAFHADQETGSNTLTQQSSALPPVPTQAIVTYLRAGAVVKADSTGGDNFSRYGVAIPESTTCSTRHWPSPTSRSAGDCPTIEIKALKDAVYLPVSTNGFMIVRVPNVDLGYQVVSGYVNCP